MSVRVVSSVELRMRLAILTGILQLTFLFKRFLEINIHERASAIGNSWRISNDIYNAWRSIWRITNEVVPYAKYTTVGAYADMDMLMYVTH